MKTRFALLVTLTIAPLTTFGGPTEDQIRFRQSAYSFISWNTGKIKAQVVDRPETFNKAQVAAAATAIAAVANSGLGSLYAPGTDSGTGWRPSRLKAEYFQKADEAKQIALEFNREANQLAKVAQNGDAAAIKEQYLKLSKTCKSCHDSFRAKE